MRRRSLKNLTLFLPVTAAFLLLVLHADAASAAAKAGLEVCLRSVIPSLFPFLILTNLLLRLELPDILTDIPGRLFERVFHIRRSAFPALLAGLMGGFPVGAEAAAACCRLGKCSPEEAGRLAVFSDNCSPGFLFGLVGSILSGGNRQAFLLLVLQWAVSLGMGVILGIGHQPSEGASGPEAASPDPVFGKITASFLGGGRSVLLICAYVVFFRVLSAFLPENALLRGMFELTGGILLLSGPRAAAVAAFLIGWGGLSAAFQVFSSLEGSEVSVVRYIPLRLLHGGMMAVCVLLLPYSAAFPVLFAALLFTAAFFVKRGRKKAVSEL